MPFRRLRWGSLAVSRTIAPPNLRFFVRDLRGVASIELAMGAVLMISVAALCVDLYARMRATVAGGRAAVSMADYVSRDTAPKWDEMVALADFLHKHEIGIPSNMVYVISVIHQPPGDPLPAAELVWTDAIEIGDTTGLTSACPQFVSGGNVALPTDLMPLPSGTLVVAEVCTRLTREGSLTGTFIAGDIYRVFALPARNTQELPADPRPTPLAHLDVVGGSLDAGRRGVAALAAIGLESRRFAVTGVST